MPDPKDVMPEQKEQTEQQTPPDPVEEAQKAEQQDEKLGGDSAPVTGETEVHRSEQDKDVSVPESGAPSPSVR